MITQGDHVFIRDKGVLIYDGKISLAPPYIIELMKEFTVEYNDLIKKRELTMNDVILQVLSSQKFADWYLTGRFDEFISDGTVSKEEILQDIEKMFKTKNPAVQAIVTKSVEFCKT